MARHKADWSELYPELLISIADKLQTRDDFRHFRSVCKKWRSSIPQIPQNLPLLSPIFPHKFSHPPPSLSKYGCNSLKIVVNCTFLLRKQNPNPNVNPSPVPFKPWLITIEELNPGKLLIRKPLRRDSIIMPGNLNFPKVLDLSGYSVKEICRAYNFRGGYIPINSKVVLFFNPESVSMSVDDCYALALNHKGVLTYLRLKDEDDYGSLRYSRVSCFDDVVNYKGAIWVVDRKGRAYVIPYATTHLSLVLFANDTVCTGYVGDTRKRLVESSEGLYLIDRYHYDELIKFRVYKLNEAERKWSEINNLDGRILFVSSDCCFFASEEDFPGWRGNCVLFPKGHFPSYYDSIYPDDFYFKGADKELEVGVFHLDNGASALISTYPGMSKIFWPPPWWLFLDTCPSWEDGEDCKEDTAEVCSDEEMCSTSLVVEETKMQSTENFLTINVQEKFQGVDVPWSDIPSKLLTEIARHLKTRIHICRFRAVCKKWRTSCPPPQSSNLLYSLLPHKISTSVAPFIDMIPSSTSFHSLILVASTVYLLQPSTHSIGHTKSWLVTVEEVNPGKLFLRMPLRRAAIKKLPDNFPKVWNLSDIHVSEISREYNFRYADSTWDMFSSFNWRSFSNSHKVVLSPAGTCTSPTIDDTTALVLYGKGNLVSFCLRDESWLAVRYGSVTKFDDIINFNGKNYAVDRRGRAYVINCNSSTISRAVSHALGSGIGPDRQKRLVESDGQLYLLVRHSPDDKIFFRVYKLNEEQNKWDEVRSLGDKILFVTPNFCYLAFAREFPGWKGNCIVFPEDCLPTNSGSTYPDWRFFRRTAEELRIGVFHLGDNDGAKLIQSYPGYSDLFWPPPAWLQLAECSSGNEMEHMDIPCKHSQQEEASPGLLENAVGGQNLDNPLASSLQASAEDVAGSKTPPVTFPVQDSETGASTVKFQGVDVRSELAPVLQKIWDKHGNITAQSAVRNPDALAQALESLAEAVLILKTTPWRSLDQSQADILSATLSGLQQKQFRVDWLLPFIENALACQKSLTLVDELETLKKTKASILEMKRQLVEMERRTDGRIKSVVELMKALGQIDFESCMGEGLC